MSSYQQKLSDPRWQKKRLEIFNRDNWACTNCGETKLELHAHHELYSGEPWEVSSDLIKTLCHLCHTNKHKALVPSIVELQREYLILIDKVNEFGRKNSWIQAMSVIEKMAQENYSVTLKSITHQCQTEF